MNTQPTLPSSSGHLLKTYKRSDFHSYYMYVLRDTSAFASAFGTSLVPRLLSEKSRRGLAKVPYNGFVPRCLYSARQSDCRVQLRHVNRFVTILLQVGVQSSDRV